jgi:hypothetical protein
VRHPWSLRFGSSLAILFSFAKNARASASLHFGQPPRLKVATTVSRFSRASAAFFAT